MPLNREPIAPPRCSICSAVPGRARSVITAVVFAALTLACRDLAAQPFIPEDHLADLVSTLKESLADEPAIGETELQEAEIAAWRFATGKDIRIHATGGTLYERTVFNNRVHATLLADPRWKEWLEVNGFVVLYEDPPADAAELIEVAPEPEEATHVAELLQTAQDNAEVDPALAGVLVTDAVFATRPGVEGRQLVVVGRIVADDQRAPMLALIEEAMAADPWWRRERRTVLVSIARLNVMTPSPDLSRRYYALGLEKFWACDYFAADEAFKRALAENPDDLILLYWRIVTHVATGQEQRAELKLHAALRRNPWGESQSLIARELWRVQGPIRWRVQALERQILLSRAP